MPALILIFIFVLIAVSSCLYIYKKIKHKQKILPQQRNLLFHLILDLQKKRHDVLFFNNGSATKPITFSLLDKHIFLNRKHEPLKAKHDDHRILFTNATEQVIDFDKYIKSDFFPKEISDELKLFHNTSYEVIKPPHEYFIIITDVKDETENYKINYDKLYEGNAEAFDSWLTFKESAQNLQYVILQWIRDNGGLKDHQLNIPFLSAVDQMIKL